MRHISQLISHFHISWHSRVFPLCVSHKANIGDAGSTAGITQKHRNTPTTCCFRFMIPWLAAKCTRVSDTPSLRHLHPHLELSSILLSVNRSPFPSSTSSNALSVRAHEVLCVPGRTRSAQPRINAPRLTWQALSLLGPEAAPQNNRRHTPASTAVTVPWCQPSATCHSCCTPSNRRVTSVMSIHGGAELQCQAWICSTRALHLSTPNATHVGHPRRPTFQPEPMWPGTLHLLSATTARPPQHPAHACAATVGRVVSPALSMPVS